MLVYNPEFVENSEYAFAVAKIRALETNFVNSAGYNSLIAAPVDRFNALFAEITMIRSEGAANVSSLLAQLEELFTVQFYMVKSLVLEDEIKRLISLEYDYEILKLIVKEERVERVVIPTEVSRRSNYSYPVLKSLLEGGKFIDTGEILYNTYFSLKSEKELNSNIIDNTCDKSYYNEVFQILEQYNNPFLTGYFIRKVDMRNILTTLRLKIRGEKRSTLRERFFPFGSIDISFLEQGLDLNLEGFTSRIIFSPLSSVLRAVEKKGEESDQVTQAEKLLEEDLLRYLKESIFVTFGIEPILAYLWTKELEVKNLRIILLGKVTGIAPEEIKRYVRGFYG